MMPSFLQNLSGWWHRLPLGGRIVAGAGGMGVFYALSYWRLGGAAALVLLLIVVGALGAFQLINWLVRRSENRKSRAADAEIQKRMARSGGAGVDESREEQDVRRQMEQRWGDVYTTLKERGYDYYSFPWYLIIGPAQSGKTTSIQKSNQEFPIGDKPVVDYGGTRGCNWFFTNRAIIVDTAGRYVDHLGEALDSWNSMLARDQQEWQTFLDMLRQMRPRSPINGVILTIKLADLLEDDPRRLERLAETLRRALLDIEERLKVRVPVYILVTMCDKLIGFVEFFRHLPGLADRTLFGWSRKGGFDATFEADELEEAFGRLREKLDRMLLEFMEEDAARGS